MDRFTESDFREMVSRLAHEIRNPLATIQSGIQLIEHLAAPEEQIREILRGMLQEVDRLDLVVRDLQELVRLEASLDPETEVAVSLDRALDSLESLAAEASVTLLALGGPSVRASIGPRHLELAVRELVSNAILASPRGATVSVSWTAEGERVVVTVDDEGQGIPADRAARILRPFYSTFTRGTGLGLNKVQRICELYGGALHWNNRALAGCRFELGFGRL